MRIALMPSAYAPAVGGVEELTARLANRLIVAGDKVEVWAPRHPPELPASETIDGVAIRRMGMPMPRWSARALGALPAQVRGAWSSLTDAARAFRPDLVHVQCFGANGVYATLLAKRMRLPLVVTLQGETLMDDTDIYDRSAALRIALRGSLKVASAVTGCSHFVVADAERRFGLAPGRGLVIPNGVEPEESSGGASLPLPFRRFVFGVGRVVHKKGFDLLLDAFAAVANRHPDVGLVIGGDGPERERIIESADAYGLGSRLMMPGFLSRGEVAWAMDAAAVFVLPSRVEPFGIVVLEALRAGCPVIVSARGGASEIIRDGLDGLVIDPYDTAALSLAIDRLLSNPPQASAFGLRGPARAGDYAWPTVAQIYRDLYDSVAG